MSVARTALLLMDFQEGIAARLEPTIRDEVVSAAILAAEATRAFGGPVIHVRTSFRTGYPEVSARNKRMSQVAAGGGLLVGSQSVQFVDGLLPVGDEVVIEKQRVSAFSDTGLGAVLRGNEINSLVLCGLTTSGVVLSTLRAAIDLDYAVGVIEAACTDTDSAAHEVLTTRIFPVHADVLGTHGPWPSELQERMTS